METTIALITGIASVLTALAALFTIREIAMQRKASYRPDIVTSSQHAYAAKRQDGGWTAFDWLKRPPEETLLAPSNRYTVSMFNLGLGAAKDIKAQWTLSLAAWVANVNSLAQQTSTPISVVLDDDGKELRIVGQQLPTNTHLVKKQLVQRWDHLLPATTAPEGIELEIPVVYLALASLQVCLGSLLPDNQGIREPWAVLPSCPVKLTYADIGGEQHERSMTCSFELLAAGHANTAFHSGEWPTYLAFLVTVH